VKVVHLIDHLGAGGSQAMLLDLLERRGPGIRPEVWTLRDRTLPSAAQRLRAAGARLRCLDMSVRNPLGLCALPAWLARARPDLLHTRLDVSNTFGAALALTLGKGRPRIVCQIENDPGQHYRRGPRWLLARMAARVDAFILLSPSLRASTEPFLRGARRVAVVQPGIDLDRFDPAAVDAASVRQLRGPARRVIGTVARLAGQKGIETLLEAAPRLLKAASNTRILIAGDGPDRAVLELRASRLGIAGAVEFLGHRHDIETVHAALDAMVLPSRHEGFGVVFLEAMAMGVPVVGTRVVGTIDAIEDGVTGLLVPPAQAGALAAAVLRLFDDPPLRRRLVEEASRRVRAEHARELMARRIEAVYASLR
jgi:glycosyltransferase involved in cell wall biosynthesis